jgi:hypothetical protein
MRGALSAVTPNCVADRVTPADPIRRVATVRRRLIRPGSAQVHGRGRDWSGDGQSLPEPPPTAKCRAVERAIEDRDAKHRELSAESDFLVQPTLGTANPGHGWETAYERQFE